MRYMVLRVWGLMPEYIPNPMILGIEALNPHQRDEARDSSINKMIYYRIERERGGVMERTSAPHNRWL
jgi:hypothetical protein